LDLGSGKALRSLSDRGSPTHLDDADLERAVLGELGEVLLEEIAGHVRLGEGEGAVEMRRGARGSAGGIG
jgi:hypothetical protein